MYSSSRDNWERLVSAVVRKQQIWELFHAHSRSPSISTIASSDDDNDDFNQQLLDNKWAAATSIAPPAPSPLNYPPSVSREARTFSLNELKIATNSFAVRNILFRDGFAKWYKGGLENGCVVAVKRYTQLQDISHYFKTEVETMSMVNAHPNLLRLIGVCVTQQENLLVYPYMANGSVASCLRDRPGSQPPLKWAVRKRIAMGAARGLAYLHDECERKIIHRDVKAANIYLNKGFDAIICNFAFAIHMDHIVRGTIGNIAPEYLSKGTLPEKTDVYGYGMFLLELITGQRVFDLARLANDKDLMLLDWVKTNLKEKKWERIVDSDIRGYYYIEEEVKQLIQIALHCTQDNPERRPDMSEIVRIMLPLGDGLLAAQRWDELCNDEITNRSDEQWDSPRQFEQLSSPR
ncbi:hypothetical protein ACP275_07G102700 [Erythranthe tilingii]